LSAPSAPAGGPLDLSIVVPVYNEEDNLPLLWPEIREVLEPTGLRYEVIFVDDGSRDRSAEMFREKDERVRLLRLKVNAGETAATDAGLKAVRGRYVVVMDADLQNDPHDIPGMLAQLERWDAVTGWRVNRAAGDSWVRRLSSRIANRVRNRLSEESIGTAAARSGPSAASACAISSSTRGSTGSSPRSSRCAGSGCSRSRSTTGRAASASPSTGSATARFVPSWISWWCAG
jgi:hypothetical protein